MGFILRVSEANGYDTPWHTLRIAGLGQGQKLTAAFSVEKLAQVLGKAPSDLQAIAYSFETSQGRKEYKVLGHRLGPSLVLDPFRLSTPAICPDCVLEHGHLDAFFDLSLAIACPDHKRAVVSHCPECESPLSFFRPSLLLCKCGASLSDAPRVSVDCSVIAYMEIVRARLLLKTSSSCPLAAAVRFPVDALLSLPLRSLLLSLPGMSRYLLTGWGRSKHDLLRVVAEALSDWPEGFYRYLRLVGGTQPDRPVSFRKRYERFLGAFFGDRALRRDFHWIYEEFLRFGLEHANDAIVDARMLRNQATVRRYVAPTTLARELGLSPATIRSWVKKGRIELTRVNSPSGVRYIADVHSVGIPSERHTDSPRLIVQLRDAAAFLGLPVSVLRRLKSSGHFVCQHRPRLKTAFDQYDLDAFLARLLALSPQVDASSLVERQTVSLARALAHYRLHDSSAKASLVVAYLAGEIRSIGRTGDGIESIHFCLSDVKARVAASRSKVASNTLSQAEVAAAIGCDPAVVPELRTRGYLDTVQACEGSRVTRASLARFSEGYVALAPLARNLETTSARLVRLANSGKIALLLVPRPAGSPAPFISRKDVDELRSLSLNSPTREMSAMLKAQIPHPAVVALSEYLTKLRSNGGKLPLRAGKPNKFAIARACGFGRDMFYDNAPVMKLLEEFARAGSTGGPEGDRDN